MATNTFGTNNTNFFGPKRSTIANFPIQIDLSGFRINADLIKASTFRMARQFGNMRWPLEQSVDLVITPSMKKNFLVCGRPPWEPLANVTANYKIKEFPSTMAFFPLIRTDRLVSNIINKNFWRITGDKADMEALDNHVPYAKYHQRGTRTVPQRQFAVLQQEDVEDIVVIFDSWIRSMTGKPDFWPYKHKEF